jgi:hypothetical protein
VAENRRGWPTGIMYGTILSLQGKQANTMLIPVLVMMMMTMIIMPKLIASFIEVSTFDLFNGSIL